MATIKFPNGTVIEGTPQEIAAVLHSMNSSDAKATTDAIPDDRAELRCDKCNEKVKVFPHTGWGRCARCNRYVEPPGVKRSVEDTKNRASSDPVFNCGKDKNGFVLNDIGIPQEYPGGPWVFGNDPSGRRNRR